MENPYKYSGVENDSESPKSIFYDTYNFFVPFSLILFTFAVPIIINEFMIKLGDKYSIVLFLYVFIVWPFCALKMLNCLKENKCNK